MFIVTVALRGSLASFPDGEGFLSVEDAVYRAKEWAALDSVESATVTTPDAYASDLASATGLLVGLGKALGYEVEFEEAAAA